MRTEASLVGGGVAEAACANPDPLHHVRRMCSSLEHARDHLREDLAKVDDPLFQQMFSGASSVLDRLVEAFRTYETLHAREPADD